MKKINFASNIIFSGVSILVLVSPLIPPSAGWIFGFTAFLIPLFILLNLAHLIYLLLQRSYLAFIPGMLLIWAYPFLPATFSMHNHQAVAATPQQLSVLSYNVSYFRKTPHWKKFQHIYTDPEKNQSAIQAKSWLQAHEADIYCFQEFYDDPDSDIFNMVNTLAPDSTYSVYLSGIFHHRKPIFLNGVAIISKFPIIQRGEVSTDTDQQANRSIFADILLNEDTIRIVNLHFHSMMLNPLPTSKNFSSLIRYVKDTYAKVKSGLLIREQQAEMTLDFINKSPYPVIVAGDFNEIPFGYVYRMFSQHLDNAFAEVGNGFGFTLNTAFPFLRIDHQFYDADAFEATRFTTLRNIKVSEHYPIQAVYRFSK